MRDETDGILLQEWAYDAIARNSRHIFRQEAEVLADSSPGSLHGMRVAIRRLESAVGALELVLELPKKVSEANIAKIGRSLSKLRNFDVLIRTLKDDYEPLLAGNERRTLDKVFKSLNKQRAKEFNRLRKALNRQSYSDFKQELQNWLKQPKYKSIGNYSLDVVLPDLLLPQLAQLLLHPGWLVGIDFTEGEMTLPQTLNQESVKELLAATDSILHHLRRTVKKTRYVLELFEPLYSDDYRDRVEQIGQIQQVLGEIQDFNVLKQTLEQNFKSEIAVKMPEFAAHFLLARYRK